MMVYANRSRFSVFSPPLRIFGIQGIVTLNGAYQVQPSGSGTYTSVTLYSDGGVLGSDTELAQYQFNDINPANTTVYWVGLAISYSETVAMTLNGFTLTGPLG